MTNLSSQIMAVNSACPINEFQPLSFKFRTWRIWAHLP